jgi:hypothetical protein
MQDLFGGILDISDPQQGLIDPSTDRVVQSGSSLARLVRLAKCRQGANAGTPQGTAIDLAAQVSEDDVDGFRVTGGGRFEALPPRAAELGCSVGVCHAMIQTAARDSACPVDPNDASFAVCSNEDLFDMATNMTLTSQMLLAALRQPTGCFGESISEDDVQRASLEDLVAQSMCCASALLDEVHRACAPPDFAWSSSHEDPRVLVFKAGSSNTSDLGFDTLAFEDARDSDSNDSVEGLLQYCVFTFAGQQPPQGRAHKLPSAHRGCVMLLLPLARGSLYENELAVALDGRIDDFGPPPEHMPLRACLSDPSRFPQPALETLAAATTFGDPSAGGVGALVGLLSQANRRLSSSGGPPPSMLPPRSRCFVSSLQSAEQPALATLGCDSSQGLKDFALIPRLRYALPGQLRGEEPAPFVNTLEGDFAEPAYHVTALVVFSQPERQPAVLAEDAEGAWAQAWFRYYLRNHNCRQLAELRFAVTDPFSGPRGVFVPSRLWCWPREGVPITLPPTFDGQCVFGMSSGLPCSEDTTECPGSVCNLADMLCGSSQLPPPRAPCTRESPCRYGTECYRRPGAYPRYLFYTACLREGCYSNPNNECIDDDSMYYVDANDGFSSDECFDPEVLHWPDHGSDDPRDLYEIELLRYIQNTDRL